MISARKISGGGCALYLGPQRTALDALDKAAARRRALERQRFERAMHKSSLSDAVLAAAQEEELTCSPLRGPQHPQ
jgi:hypothetical protein